MVTNIPCSDIKRHQFCGMFNLFFYVYIGCRERNKKQQAEPLFRGSAHLVDTIQPILSG